MSNAEIELQTLAARAGAGLIDLSGRARLEVRGPERQTWLQGMVTNDLAKLGAGQGCAATALNNKGKLLGNLRIWLRPDTIWIDAEPVRRGPLLEHLAHFIVMEDCEIRDVSEGLASLAVVGPKAWSVAQAVFPPLAPLGDYAQMDLGGTVAAGESDLGLPGVRLWVPPADKKRVWSGLEAAGAVALSADAVEVLRLEAGQPREGAELDDDVIPLEAGLERAISDTKGCYLGQEVIARISHRGHVNRKLVGLTLSGVAPSALPAPLTKDDKPVGELRSAVWSPTLKRVIGLGYVRRELLAPGNTVALAEGSTATVTELPFVKL